MRRTWTLFLLIFLFILTGCYTDIPSQGSMDDSSSTQSPGTQTEGSHTVPDPDEMQTFPCPVENLRAVSSSSGNALPVPGDFYYSVSGGKIRYVDISTGRGSFWCFQTGCTHEDETCPAYVRGLDCFISYGGMWYCLCTDEEESGYYLISVNPETNERKEMVRWKSSDDGYYYYITDFIASYGRLYFSVDYYRVDDPDADIYGADTYGQEAILYFNVAIAESRVDCIDLQTQEYTKYPFDDQLYKTFGYTPSGKALVQKAVCEYGTSQEEIDRVEADREQYNRTHNTDISYPNFKRMHTYFELDLLDLKSGEIETIADSENDGYVDSTSTNSPYGNLLPYQLHDSLYVYDMETEQGRKITDAKNILNYWIIDNRLIFIVRSVFYTEDPAYFWYAPLYGGEPVQLKNNGNTEVLQYNPLLESDSYFSDDFLGRSWIEKKHFYAEN